MNKKIEIYDPLPFFKKNCLKINCDYKNLSPFQFYLWSWIEIELRIVRFLSQNPQVPSFHIKTAQLNHLDKMQKLLDFFNLPLRNRKLQIVEAKNANIMKTNITKKDFDEASAILKLIGKEQILKLRDPFNLKEFL